jgi:hypothetical protein
MKQTHHPFLGFNRTDPPSHIVRAIATSIRQNKTTASPIVVLDAGKSGERMFSL